MEPPSEEVAKAQPEYVETGSQIGLHLLEAADGSSPASVD
jgi:hypothetical protein